MKPGNYLQNSIGFHVYPALLNDNYGIYILQIVFCNYWLGVSRINVGEVKEISPLNAA